MTAPGGFGLPCVNPNCLCRAGRGDCPGLLVDKAGGRKFCCPSCAARADAATQNARQVVCRLRQRWSRRDFLQMSAGTLFNFSRLLEATPPAGSVTRSLEQTLEELRVGDRLFFDRGRHDPAERQARRDLATACLLALERAPAHTLPVQYQIWYQVVHAYELLRDIGTESAAQVTPRLWYFTEVPVAFYADGGDNANLGGALLHEGQVCRLDGHERRAKDAYRQAVHVLRAARRERPHDREVAILLQQALLYDLQRSRDLQQFREAHDLAEEIDDPTIWSIIWRERINFWLRVEVKAARQMAPVEEAVQHIRAFRARFGSSIPNCLTLSLLRSEVEVDFALGRRNDAKDRVRDELLPLYRLEKHWSPTTMRLWEWVVQHRLGQHLWKDPVFTAPTIFELPRHGQRLILKGQA